MFNHTSPDYICPICPAIQGIENEHTWIVQDDIFYRDDLVLGFIGTKFVERNPGYPLLVPIAHYEHLYDIPAEVGHRLWDVSRRTALALKELRQCDGTTIIQHNEPAGDQHAFHYHMHVVPRFDGDEFYHHIFNNRKSAPEERRSYASELREYFQQ